MPTVGGEPIPFRSLPTQDVRKRMIVALGNIHAQGRVHGDPRHVNCVLVKGKCKWIDFMSGDLMTTQSIVEDMELFLKSLGVDFVANVETYARNMVYGDWKEMTLTKILLRNKYLTSML